METVSQRNHHVRWPRYIALFMRRLLLGNPTDLIASNQRWWADATRAIAFVCLFCGVLSILLSSAREIQPFESLQQVIWPVAVAFVNLLYLTIVLRLLIFDVPTHLLRGRAMWMPAILILSYITYTADVYSEPLDITHINLRPISVALFGLVYIIWAVRDWAESLDTDGDLRMTYRYWICVDVFLVILLAVDLFVYRVPLPRYMSMKDIVVIICVFAYFALRKAVVLINRDAFVGVYSAYLDATDSAAKPVLVGRVDDIRSELLAAARSQSAITAIDFGSGDSRRLWWLFEEFGMLDRDPSRLTILMYDEISKWAEYRWDNTTAGKVVIENLRERGWVVDVKFTSAYEDVESFAENCSFIHASHSVYDTTALRQFTGIVRRSPSGCIVALRGIGSSIFRRMSEGTCMVNARVKNTSHLWNTAFLHTIMHEGLRDLNGGSGRSSCLVLNQKVSGTQRLRIENFLRTIYVREWNQKISGLYDATLRHESFDGETLNNQDWLLFLKK